MLMISSRSTVQTQIEEGRALRAQAFAGLFAWLMKAITIGRPPKDLPHTMVPA